MTDAVTRTAVNFSRFLLILFVFIHVFYRLLSFICRFFILSVSHSRPFISVVRGICYQLFFFLYLLMRLKFMDAVTRGEGEREDGRETTIIDAVTRVANKRQSRWRFTVAEVLGGYVTSTEYGTDPPPTLSAGCSLSRESAACKHSKLNASHLRALMWRTCGCVVQVGVMLQSAVCFPHPLVPLLP